MDAGPSSHGEGAHDFVAAILGSFAIFPGSLGGNLGRVACMPGLQRNSLGKVPLFVVPACTCYAAEDARHFGQVCCIVLYILSTGDRMLCFQGHEAFASLSESWASCRRRWTSGTPENNHRIRNSHYSGASCVRAGLNFRASLSSVDTEQINYRELSLQRINIFRSPPFWKDLLY